MEVNRRQMIVLAACACAGCASNAPKSANVSVDAGPASQYDADGVYDHYRHDGFFLVRQGASLVAISSACTHRDCPLRAMPDQTFSCRCHGSRFDVNGSVLKGPAQRRLAHFETSVDANQHLIVRVTQVAFDEG